MTRPTVEALMIACGQPVAGHSLSVEEMAQAVKEERVIEIGYYSSFGEGEASFYFATRYGLDGRGGVHHSYIVFPKPIPPELREKSAETWEKPYEVFESFGLDP